jgi:hypothetical protein
VVAIHLLIAKSRDLQQAWYTLIFGYMINSQSIFHVNNTHMHTFMMNIDRRKKRIFSWFNEIKINSQSCRTVIQSCGTTIIYTSRATKEEKKQEDDD